MFFPSSLTFVHICSSILKWYEPLLYNILSKWIFKVILVVVQALSEFIFQPVIPESTTEIPLFWKCIYSKNEKYAAFLSKTKNSKSVHETGLQRSLFFFPWKGIQETHHFLQWWWILSRSWSNRILTSCMVRMCIIIPPAPSLRMLIIFTF